MAPRAQLQLILEQILPNVYFQPPPNVQMEYPAIVYQRARADSVFANNDPYRVTKQYEVTMITRNPDESAFDALVLLPMCTHERNYVADNLNHDVFNIYF
jgi:hypothetical protein